MSSRFTGQSLDNFGTMRYKWILEWGLPILFMIVFSVLYFLPLYQGYRFKALDLIQQEYMMYPMKKVEKERGASSLWAPHLFSGMPAYLVYYHPEGQYFRHLPALLGPLFRHHPPLIFFVGLLGFFLFLRVEGAKWSWALAGAFGFVLTSYYTNMIVATHWGKSIVLFSVPYVLAGMGHLHRSQYLVGVILLLLGWAGIAGGHHPQMAYYSLLVMGAY
ncbi:MAG: hypothetical protein RMJ66_06835, partial [Bacteroidia bacterium]|nr:hypothetical protein [Bacteroidia bacterium]MDW8134768.1 hypothetical protein [Bacteroidia bacterium]